MADPSIYERQDLSIVDRLIPIRLTDDINRAIRFTIGYDVPLENAESRVTLRDSYLSDGGYIIAAYRSAGIGAQGTEDLEWRLGWRISQDADSGWFTLDSDYDGGCRITYRQDRDTLELTPISALDDMVVQTMSSAWVFVATAAREPIDCTNCTVSTAPTTTKTERKTSIIANTSTHLPVPTRVAEEDVLDPGEEETDEEERPRPTITPADEDRNKRGENAGIEEQLVIFGVSAALAVPLIAFVSALVFFRLRLRRQPATRPSKLSDTCGSVTGSRGAMLALSSNQISRSDASAKV